MVALPPSREAVLCLFPDAAMFRAEDNGEEEAGEQRPPRPRLLRPPAPARDVLRSVRPQG